MDTDTIVRRIIQLKKVSVELKQSTQNSNMTNTDLVKNILRFGRQMGPLMLNSLKQGNNMSMNRNIDDRKYDNLYRNSSQDGRSVNNSKLMERSEHNNSVNLRESLSVSGRGWQGQYLSPVQQIKELKNENSDLEGEILQLRQKLRKLDEIERQQK